ncbi:major facilitator superfamily MFS-1 transporter [Burkholderia plantarii]|uniref:Major facilitator superfamily MFS-1 transporter n=1 Tax=Burkholderia plantarii TaxID=41899 RepID=A0A0B6RJZ4_BURPL|nr:major facilitator superfamily MFS-1 transporter [Burkholderia plantarii]
MANFISISASIHGIETIASLRAGRRANRVVIPASATDLHGWRAAFRVLVAMILAGGACVRLLPPRARYFERQRRIDPGLLAMARHPRNPRLMAIYACAFNLFVFVSAFTHITFELVQPPFGPGRAALGLMFLPNLFGAVANPFAGRWMGRVGYRTGLIAALAIDTLGILLTRVPNLVVALIGVFVAQTAATGRMGVVAGKAKSSAAGV